MVVISFCYYTNIGLITKMVVKTIKLPFLPKMSLDKWFKITHKFDLISYWVLYSSVSYSSFKAHAVFSKNLRKPNKKYNG